MNLGSNPLMAIKVNFKSPAVLEQRSLGNAIERFSNGTVTLAHGMKTDKRLLFIMKKVLPE